MAGDIEPRLIPFGPFVADLKSQELTKNGVRLHVASPIFTSHKSRVTSHVPLTPLDLCTFVRIWREESALTKTPGVAPPPLRRSSRITPDFALCPLCGRLPRPGRDGKSSSEE
jgi:hypothetical protein